MTDNETLAAQLAACKELIHHLTRVMPIATHTPTTSEEAELDAAAALAVGEDIVALLERSRHLFPAAHTAEIMMREVLDATRTELGWTEP